MALGGNLQDTGRMSPYTPWGTPLLKIYKRINIYYPNDVTAKLEDRKRKKKRQHVWIELALSFVLKESIPSVSVEAFQGTIISRAVWLGVKSPPFLKYVLVCEFGLNLVKTYYFTDNFQKCQNIKKAPRQMLIYPYFDKVWYIPGWTCSGW